MALGARAKGVTGYDFAAPYNDLIDKSGDLNNVGAKRRRQLRSRQSSFTSSVAGGRPSDHVLGTSCVAADSRKTRDRLYGMQDGPAAAAQRSRVLRRALRGASDLARIEARQAEIEVG